MYTPATTPPALPGTPRTEDATPKSAFANTSRETDREALVTLYNATDGPKWSNNHNWLSDASLRQWSGVTTDRIEGRVIELELARNELRGEIPADLGNLANLEKLNLGRNKLRGEIPA